MMEKMRNKKKKGFTLVELIVVLVIIGILVAIAIPRLGGFTDSAKERSAQADAKTVLTAISTMYADDNDMADPTQDEIEGLTGNLAGVVTGVGVESNGDISFVYTLDNAVVNVVDGVLGS